MQELIERPESEIVPPKDWIWLPHAAHFCGADSCKFRMATVVGEFIISTVGEYYPPIRVSIKEVLDDPEPIGWDRTYETMVFPAKKIEDGCCEYGIVLEELEMEGYKIAKDARLGHMEMCWNYSRMKLKTDKDTPGE